jgi:hypothetical protein
MLDLEGSQAAKRAKYGSASFRLPLYTTLAIRTAYHYKVSQKISLITMRVRFGEGGYETFGLTWALVRL